MVTLSLEEEWLGRKAAPGLLSVTTRSAPPKKHTGNQTRTSADKHKRAHTQWSLVLLCCDSETKRTPQSTETLHGVPQEVFWFQRCVREGRVLLSLLSSFRPSTLRYVVRRHLSDFSVVLVDVVFCRVRTLQEVFPDLTMTFSRLLRLGPGDCRGKRSNALQTVSLFQYPFFACGDNP